MESFGQRGWVNALLCLAGVACTRGHGPHIQLNTPSAPSPNFGDEDTVDSHTWGGGPGGGGGPTGARESVVGRSPTNDVGVAAGVIAGSTALVVSVASGTVTCKPGETPSSADAGPVMNLCSGERREAAPDLKRAFSPLGTKP